MESHRAVYDVVIGFITGPGWSFRRKLPEKPLQRRSHLRAQGGGRAGGGGLRGQASVSAGSHGSPHSLQIQYVMV
jgi:hypothetical protein